MKASDLIDKNISIASNNNRDFPSKLYEEQYDYQIDGEQLQIDKLQLSFNVPINDIAKKEIKIKNIGNSAIYIEFKFKNDNKINQNGFKDSKNKFYYHNQNNVIKPKEEIIYFFSFISQFAGSFTEEVEIQCQPPLRTPIPCLKLNGNAYIEDQWQKGRKCFGVQLEENVLKNQVREILDDVVSRVRLPPPPLPDVKIASVAEE